MISLTSENYHTTKANKDYWSVSLFKAFDKCEACGLAMTEGEYETDGRITNPMEMPTTIGRVVAFAETQCDKMQKQTIQLLAQWLRDDYEQTHSKEIEALAEADPLVMINGDVKGDVIERGGTKNENGIGKFE